jgi:hypothetical protein
MSAEFREDIVRELRAQRKTASVRAALIWGPATLGLLAFGFALGGFICWTLGWPTEPNLRLIVCGLSMLIVFVVSLVALVSVGFSPRSNATFRPEMLPSNLDVVSGVLLKHSAPPWYLRPGPLIWFLATLVTLCGSAVLD